MLQRSRTRRLIHTPRGRGVSRCAAAGNLLHRNAGRSAGAAGGRVRGCCEHSTRSARLARIADRAVPGPAACSGACGVNLSAGAPPAASVAAEESRPEGQNADRRRVEAALGSQYSSHGGAAGSRQAPHRRYPVDHGPRQRLSRSAERRHGRRPANAPQSGERDADVDPATDGADTGRRARAGHRDRAIRPGGHLRS